MPKWSHPNSLNTSYTPHWAEVLVVAVFIGLVVALLWGLST